MAQWIQTLEPYVRVHEEIKTTTINPTAGEDLIIGATIISDTGPSTPTLISGQKEFLSTYASQEVTKEYIESLNNLYQGDDKTLAATMWSNAYRLAGSNTLLITRASKADGKYFTKPFSSGESSLDTYLLRDGELMKRADPFQLSISEPEAGTDGWAIAINGVGVFGNYTTNEGPQYDYYANTLESLAEQLNDTTKFFSPSYHYKTDTENGTIIFEEVYFGVDALDLEFGNNGLANLTTTTFDPENPEGDTYIIDSDDPETKGQSNFTPAPYYAVNRYNAATDLKVRIRRFNHNAVISKELSDLDTASLNENGSSPYIVLEDVLNVYTKGGTIEPKEPELYYDFYEVAVWDTSINDKVSFFNIGNVTGRGDMEVSELNNLLGMIQVNLPDNMLDLELGYYGFLDDVYAWKKLSTAPSETPDIIKNNIDNRPEANKDNFEDICKINHNKIGVYEWEETEDAATEGDVTELPTPSHDNYGNIVHNTTDNKNYKCVIGWEDNLDEDVQIESGQLPENPTESDFGKIYTESSDYYQCENTGSHSNQFFVNLKINTTGDDATSLISVSDSDLKKGLDELTLDEVYTTEGLSDLGNTELSFQNYMANIAVNENYFYPISSVNSTNYMTIGNSATKISQDSCKLYMSSPWDIDSGTLGWKFYVSPSVLFWEAVSRNKRNNNEFASIFGQSTGVVQYQRPVTEFNKKTRQLLLSRKVNTVVWNVPTQTWIMNDSYTKESENNILNEDGNSRLMIRISKAMPTLLRQFIGKKISVKLCNSIYGVIDYFFKTVILPMNYTVDAYQIFCEYDEALARQNKVKVVINVRYPRSLKYIEVYNNAFDVGMDISNPN